MEPLWVKIQWMWTKMDWVCSRTKKVFLSTTHFMPSFGNSKTIFVIPINVTSMSSGKRFQLWAPKNQFCLDDEMKTKSLTWFSVLDRSIKYLQKSQGWCYLRQEGAHGRQRKQRRLFRQISDQSEPAPTTAEWLEFPPIHPDPVLDLVPIPQVQSQIQEVWWFLLHNSLKIWGGQFCFWFYSDSHVLSDDQCKWIDKTEAKVYELMSETPPHGQKFGQSVKHILHREKQWNLWKNEGCPSLVSTEKNQDEAKKKSSTDGDSKPAASKNSSHFKGSNFSSRD